MLVLLELYTHPNNAATPSLIFQFSSPNLNTTARVPHDTISAHCIYMKFVGQDNYEEVRTEAAPAVTDN